MDETEHDECETDARRNSQKRPFRTSDYDLWAHLPLRCHRYRRLAFPRKQAAKNRNRQHPKSQFELRLFGFGAFIEIVQYFLNWTR